MENEKATFDPSKNYQWNKDTEFKLTGEQFGYLQGWINSEMKKQEVQDAIPVITMSNVLHELLVKGIESGDVVEKVEEEGEKEG